jgi:hypothetical protein
VDIVDEDGNSLPAGTAGEIAVAGPFISRGYWREADTGRLFETAATEAGSVRLRTGDVGRLRPDGLLVHLGRKDFRVKIRGFRVELEAIEAELQRAPGVHTAAVVVRGTPPDPSLLIAYFTGDSDVAGSAQVAAHARAHLSPGSVPHQFVPIDALPFTASGKVDRAALRALDEARRLDRTAPAIATFRDDEATVAGIWRDVLGHARFGRHDDFLSAGGDSLSAMRVLTRIRQLLEVEVGLQAFLAAPTVAALGAAVGDARRREADLDEHELCRILDEVESERSGPL